MWSKNKVVESLCGFISFIALTTTFALLPACKSTSDSYAKKISVKGDGVRPVNNKKTTQESSKSYTPPPLSPKEEALIKEFMNHECLEDYNCPLYLRCISFECAVPHAITGQITTFTPRILFKDKETNKTSTSFFIELATTEEEMMRGLMFRREMKPNWGMLFLYPDAAPRSFWMKNTYLPLDMIFIAADGKVNGVVEEAEPLSLTSRKVKGNSRYVLEVNAGLAKQFNIKEGDFILLENISEDALPVKMQ